MRSSVSSCCLHPPPTNSKTRIRHCTHVSRIGDVSDTDTPGIRPGYVSAACPRIPGYVGRKLKNGDVSARSIRPSSPVASFVTYSRVPTSRSHLRLTHGQKAGRHRQFPASRSSRRRPPPRRPSPRLAIRVPDRRRRSRVALRLPDRRGQAGARVALRLPDWAPSSAADSRSSSRRRPPRGVVALPESPFDSQIGAAKAATLLGRPRSEADDLLKTRRPLPAVVLLPPSCSSSLSSSCRLHPRAISFPSPRPGQRPARTRRGAPRRPRFASTQPPPTKPALDSCPHAEDAHA